VHAIYKIAILYKERCLEIYEETTRSYSNYMKEMFLIQLIKQLTVEPSSNTSEAKVSFCTPSFT
jgi:predicted AAA+ superfamily ATPase